MHVFLDHLTAVLVGTVLLAVVASVAFSARQTGIEATQHYAAREQTLAFLDVMKQDLANVGAEVPKEQAAIVAWTPGAPTRTLTFRGAVDPSANALVAGVRYRTLDAPPGPDGQPRYRIVRSVWEGAAWRHTGGSPPIVTAFEIQLRRDGQPLPAGQALDTAEEAHLYLTTAGGSGAVRQLRWESRYPLSNLRAPVTVAPGDTTLTDPEWSAPLAPTVPAL